MVFHVKLCIITNFNKICHIFTSNNAKFDHFCFLYLLCEYPYTVIHLINVLLS